MDAKFRDGEFSNAKQHYKKEVVSNKHVVAYRKGELHHIVDARCYMGRANNASVVYANIWVHDHTGQRWCSGSSSAGGWGYHKESAAIGEAIRSAGIELSSDINGRGSSAIDDALKAIARALKYKIFIII
jgi:hypothetical protein